MRPAAWRAMTRPGIRSGLALLALLAAAALAAPLLAPAPPHEQLDPVAARLLPPGSKRILVPLRDGRSLLAEAAWVEGEELVLRRLGRDQRLPRDLVSGGAADGRPERRLFLLGSDRLGRDLWSRLLHGARISLAVGLLAAVLALTIGALLGSVAALSPGVVDGLLMRATDALLMMPRIYLLLAITGLFHTTDRVLVLVLAATGWMPACRLARAEMLALQRREFVTAARASGLSPLRILVRHLLPNAVAPLLVDTTLRIGRVILVEASLSFLGLGIQPPAPSWGNMVADGSQVLTSAWWVATFPGLAIAATVVGFGLLSDGLRDALDPRRRRTG